MNKSDFLPFIESQRQRVAEVKNAHSIYQEIERFGAGGGGSNGGVGGGGGEDETTSAVQVNISSGRVATIRKLFTSEIGILTNVCICQCDDWSSVYLMVVLGEGTGTGTSTGTGTRGDGTILNRHMVEDALKAQVKNCSFSGVVVLGISLDHEAMTKTKTNARVRVRVRVRVDPTKTKPLLKPGIQNNTLISNSIIEPGATVYDNSIIANCVIGSNATVLNCGSISTSLDNKSFSFSDLMTIGVGPEAGGGRPISVIPESSMIDVCSSLGMNSTSSDNDSDNDNDNARTRWPSKLLGKSIDIMVNLIHGDVLHVKVASNLFVSKSATIQSCASVDNAILLPLASIENSIASKIFLQWNSSIVNNSNVSDTLLMEYSEIGPNSVVASTVLGPDSHVSCGEVHCSVIGPNTNSHHQSLLISVLWPAGRGNVGYGSNIGSNHTGRIPDQECTVGEGVFWGLGSVIKFPVDLSKSYYSIVAAGVQLPPQSVAMPFSLIMSGNPKLSAEGMNELVPGWLLQSSPYTILRSSVKFRKRRKAKRHGFYCGWDIIRPLTVDTCIDARNDLVAFERIREGAENTPLLIVGQNYVSSRGVSVGINAYTNMIHRYALSGLLAFLQECLEKGIGDAELGSSFYRTLVVSQQKRKIITNTKKISWPCLPWEEETHGCRLKLLQHKIKVLAAELPSIIDIGLSLSSASRICIACLQRLSNLEGEHAKQVLRSKARDDKRGISTIPGYANFHVRAEDDPVVKLANADAVEVISDCDKIIALLSWDKSKL
uniref:DUF4954 domain-containing protein n=1 Tax=Chaetoceros debilis TaxID=122233 RepID=A0A7S3QA94_9STRA|mmetsp:Transcript_21628/g.32879  ORF Transcript_21628/g.32879 Transcript_21628/m.32879 type:complete len:774 (-) Transcript_21628:54-2375(-)